MRFPGIGQLNTTFPAPAYVKIGKMIREKGHLPPAAGRFFY